MYDYCVLQLCFCVVFLISFWWPTMAWRKSLSDVFLLFGALPQSRQGHPYTLAWTSSI